MNSSIFRIFQIFGIVSNWSSKALADGKITLEEAVSLAKEIAMILGVKIEIEVPVNAPKIDDKEYVEFDEDITGGGVFYGESSKPPED